MSGLTEHQIFYRRLLRKCPHVGTYNPDAALKLIHRRGSIHPDDVFAFVYRTRNDALLHSRSNREAYGHDILAAAFPVKGVGWLSIITIRKWLRIHGPGPTDPAKPWDGWPHHGVWHPTGAGRRRVSGVPAPAAGRRSPPETGPADADGTPHTAPPPDPTDQTPE